MKIFPIVAMLFACPIAAFGQAKGKLRPEMFAAGVISTNNVFSSAFTPDGRTVYFTQSSPDRGHMQIMVSRRHRGRWTTPTRADFAGNFRDFDPFITSDGTQLFFNSNRPVNGDTTGEATKDSNLWVVTKTPSGWSVPQYVPAPVNSEFSDFYVTVASNGTLYFSSNRTGGRGGVDIYRSTFANSQYAAPENLSEINSETSDSNPYIAPDESYLIFFSDRAGGFGQSDLYISYNHNGRWTTPQNLGAAINTADAEFCPMVSPDNKYVYFSRSTFVSGKRVGENIYRIRSAAVKSRKR